MEARSISMLYDSHAHLNNEDFSEEERAAFIARIERAVESGLLSYVNDIGFDMVSSRLALSHALKYPWCYAVIGVHPHDVGKLCDDDLQELASMALSNPDRVKAIGEIGLDYHYDDGTDPMLQVFWFRKQIRLARELGLPISIHSRDADGDTFDILKQEYISDPKPCGAEGAKDKAPLRGVLLHCYSGSAELAREYIKLGAMISIAGSVTYKNNKKTVRVVEEVPLERLLIETDSPYLSPVPFRGQKNHPINVRCTAEKIAEIKGISFEEVAETTRENALRFFGIR